jgi:hypothetical protein
LIPLIGKRRRDFASFTTKERLNFPTSTHYHVDIIAYENFLTEKFNADWWQIFKAVFQRWTAHTLKSFWQLLRSLPCTP